MYVFHANFSQLRFCLMSNPNRTLHGKLVNIYWATGSYTGCYFFFFIIFIMPKYQGCLGIWLSPLIFSNVLSYLRSLQFYFLFFCHFFSFSSVFLSFFRSGLSCWQFSILNVDQKDWWLKAFLKKEMLHKNLIFT